MQHTRIDPLDLHLCLAIPALQAAVGLASRGFMRIYLLSGAIVGAVGISIACFASLQAYTATYRISIFLYEGLALFASIAMMNLVRRQGLISRQSIIPIQIVVGIAFTFGIRAASSSLILLRSPSWRVLISWDQAFQIAICLMIGSIPIYAVYLSSTLPKSLTLKIIGFGAYSAANAGALDHLVVHHTFSHVADFVHLASLIVWLIAGRADWKVHPASMANFEMEDFPTET